MYPRFRCQPSNQKDMLKENLCQIFSRIRALLKSKFLFFIRASVRCYPVLVPVCGIPGRFFRIKTCGKTNRSDFSRISDFDRWFSGFERRLFQNSHVPRFKESKFCHYNGHCILTREHGCILYTGTRLCSLNVNGPLWAPRMTYPKNSLNHPL